MKIKFTDHARERMRERNLSRAFVTAVAVSPDKVEPSARNSRRFLFKKVYYNSKLKKEHLLMLVVEREGRGMTIVTIVDTSKVRKYM